MTKMELPATILYPEAFLASLPADFDGPFDWEYLNKAFPGPFRFTDVDGEVERRGYFLTVETKNYNVPIEPFDGAIRALREKTKLRHRNGRDPAVHAFILWGKGGAEPPAKWQHVVDGRLCKIKKCTASDVFNFCRTWYECASRDDMSKLRDIYKLLKLFRRPYSRPSIIFRQGAFEFP